MFQISIGEAPVESAKPRDGFIYMFVSASSDRVEDTDRCQKLHGFSGCLQQLLHRLMLIARFSHYLAVKNGELISADDQSLAISSGHRFRLVARQECRQLLRVIDVCRLVDARRYGLVIVEEAIEQVLPIDR